MVALNNVTATPTLIKKLEKKKAIHNLIYKGRTQSCI